MRGTEHVARMGERRDV